MSVFGGCAIWAIVIVAVAVLVRSNAGARIGVLIAAALLPLPLLVGGDPMLRMMLTYMIIIGLASAVDFASGRNPQTVVARLSYVLAFLTLADAYSAMPTRRGSRLIARTRSRT